MKEILFFLLLLVILVLGLFLIYYKLRSLLQTQLNDPFISLKERLYDLREIRNELQRLYLAENLLKDLREELFKLSQIFISRASGKAAERALEDILSIFPSHLLKRDLKLSTGEVEFALVLPGEKYLPIDSKFVAPEILKKGELSPEDERELLKRVKARAKELKPYLKDEKSPGFAIMACPDGIFPYLQRRIYEELEKEKIILLPYSLLPSVLLFIHFLWERFGRVFEEDKISEGIANFEKWILELERDLEKLSRELRSAENLLNKLKETHHLLKRDFLKLLNHSQSSSNSRGISE
ncbi:MAG: DNA recombination protein RmuC [Caldimicrobium sp.]